MKHQILASFVLLTTSLTSCTVGQFQSHTAGSQKENLSPFRRSNLVAWCIVPFDGKKRGPEERAKMVRELGLRRVAYDWRQHHVASFEEEILQYKRKGIEYFAFWDAHEKAFQLFKKYGLKPQIWKTLSSPQAKTQEERVRLAAERFLPLVEKTRKLGSRLGLYNHGGWGGEPQNLIAVCEYLKKHHNAPHVGIVYNQHHGHAHITEFKKHLKLMMPHLLCLNLNGMNTEGDRKGQKILPLGEGEHDVRLLKIIQDSGYQGPIGIIGHTQDDVRERLQDNLDGLDWILPQLKGLPPGEKKVPRTLKPKKKQPEVQGTGELFKGDPKYRTPPLTLIVKAKLKDSKGYNILVASDTKPSGEHWELFSMNGTGTLTAYLPGYQPDHVRSQANVCDGKSHLLGMIYEEDRVRLYVDGKKVGESKVSFLNKSSRPGKLGVGRLVEEGLSHRGTIEQVVLYQGIHEEFVKDLSQKTDSVKPAFYWTHAKNKRVETKTSTNTPELKINDSKEIQKSSQWILNAQEKGNPHRGLMLFSSDQLACLSCHQIQGHGGKVGPDLSKLALERRPEEILQAVLEPQKVVPPEYVASQIVLSSGETHQVYIQKRDTESIHVIDSVTRIKQVIPLKDIVLERKIGSLMPDNLLASLKAQQKENLLSFLLTLGTEKGVQADEVHSMVHHAKAHLSGPKTFTYKRDPLDPPSWPNWQHHINRERVYDFYLKEAQHFRAAQNHHGLLMAYPGMDGGQQGHWGNQSDKDWEDGRWNETDLGSLQSGVFRGGGITVAKGICVRFGEVGELATCFNPETLNYELVWKGGFLKFSPFRHGFINGLLMEGEVVEKPNVLKFNGDIKYLGLIRSSNRVIFHYRVGSQEYYDTPWIEDGKFKRIVKPVDTFPLKALIDHPKGQWDQEFETQIKLGKSKPYSVDSIELPFENPWKALLFLSGHGFLSDGSALVSSMTGDVWHVSGFKYPSKKVRWKRFASGLHQALGLVVHDDQVYVLGRDQITLLEDRNQDGEADYYRCFSNAYKTSTSGHDYICGLERDADGNFYTASGNQGLIKISKDGQSVEVLATGFRNPDGIGLQKDGTLTVPCSEGGWTPASMVCAIQPKEQDEPSFFGYRGPKNGKAPALPLVYFPRGIDNSSGGQVQVSSERWGPLKDQLIHFSFGRGTHFLILQDKVKGQRQGAVVPLKGEFLSGAHRGRFHPLDGQLYVTGMQGWGSYTPNDGCFQRVRYTQDRVQLPIRFRVHENGVFIQFSRPVDTTIASQAKRHFAQAWNYRYSSAYGSQEYSPRHPRVQGHDAWRIKSSYVLADGKSLFLEIPDLQPVNQLHLVVQSSAQNEHELFITVHRLDQAFTQIPNYQPSNKTIQAHPMENDLLSLTKSYPNPFVKKLDGARVVEIEAGSSLTFKTSRLEVKAGERIALTFINPDAVPHNWALIKPGTLERIGELTNKLISDPEAGLKQYIPASDDVLAYTDIVDPKGRFTIYFEAPKVPGRYPYLCTFPGHWRVMNGEMVVTK